MSDNGFTVLGYPVQHVLIHKIVSSYGADDWFARMPAPLDIEGLFLLCERRNDRFIPRAEAASGDHSRTLRRGLSPGAARHRLKTVIRRSPLFTLET